MKHNLVRFFAWLIAFAAIAPGASPATAAETLTMVTTGKGSAQQWPIYIAIAKGYMAENGVALDLIAASSTAGATEASAPMNRPSSAADSRTYSASSRMGNFRWWSSGS